MRNLDRRQGDAIGVLEIGERLEFRPVDIEKHGGRVEGKHATDIEIAARLVPQGQEWTEPGRGEFDAAGDQRVVHRGAAAETDPVHLEGREAGRRGTGLDQLAIARHDQGQERQAELLSDPNLADLGPSCRQRHTEHRGGKPAGDGAATQSNYFAHRNPCFSSADSFGCAKVTVATKGSMKRVGRLSALSKQKILIYGPLRTVVAPGAACNTGAYAGGKLILLARATSMAG